jgi:glucose-1-phosphate cytidylyltransferase
MKAVIFAGGFGTRLSEETTTLPKPLIDVGGKPILWHIMKIYSAHGIDEFILCLGYKGYLIKEFFSNYFLHTADVTFDLGRNRLEVHAAKTEPWRVTLVDTGLQTLTGGRLKRVARYLGNDDFCLTYGDGVADIDLTALIDFHRRQRTLATLTAVRPPGRFGALQIQGSQVTRFQEKPEGGEDLINGGFFVLSPKVLDYIEGDRTSWEAEPLQQLARDGQLSAFRHDGFWQPMDTLRDKRLLEELWASGTPPWKIWQDAPEHDNDERFLVGQTSAPDGAHGLQGSVAEPVAPVAGSTGHRIRS